MTSAAPTQQQTATTTTTPTPFQRRGPLSHFVDALRDDNHQLLLETLQQVGGIGGGASENDNAPSKFEDETTMSSAAGVVGNVKETPSVSKQVLIFGSSDLRRVILRQVMDTNNSNNSKKKGTAKNSNSKKNVTVQIEEENILKIFNDQLRNSSFVNRTKSSSLGSTTQIVGTHELSPKMDGSVISPYHHHNNNNTTHDHDSAIINSLTAPNNNNENATSGSSKNSSMIITYILRGGGFDLSNIANAALHRRRILNLINTPNTKTNTMIRVIFRFILVPRITDMEYSFLNELGVKESLSTTDDILLGGGRMNPTTTATTTLFESLPIDLIPLDDDVFSLELTGGSCSGLYDTSTNNATTATTASSTLLSSTTKSATTTMMNEGDRSGGGGSPSTTYGSSNGTSASALRHSIIEGCETNVADIVARSIIKLQLLNRGAIPRVQGLGSLATAVIDRMMTLRIEEELIGRMEDEDEDDGRQTDDAAEVVGGEGANAQSTTSMTSVSSLPSIQALIVIDRRIDLVTPMLTPLTYEGLIDDVLQIQVGGCVSVKKTIIEPDDDPKSDQQHQWQQKHQEEVKEDTVLLLLNDSDPLYTEVRDKHVETFGSFLQNQAKALKESHSQFTNREAAQLDLTEIHQFVKQIPVFTRNLRSLTNHIHIAELVKSAAEATSFRQRWQTERSMLESEPCYEHLEDVISTGLEPPYRWLRLLCLQSLTSNGIKATRYDALRREVIQTYGYEYLFVLNDLEKAGFLRKRETFFIDSMATPYSALRKALNLINPDIDPSNPEDVAYVSSGYAPMTVRWVEAAMKGYSGLDEAMKELPVGVGSGGGSGGRLVDVEQRWPPETLLDAMKRKRGPSLGTWAEQHLSSANESSNNSRSSMEGGKPVLLVYFVGGITFMELAAFRFLSRHHSCPYNIVCCTTEIVNGGTLLKSLSC